MREILSGKVTTEAILGVPRCLPCFPGAAFDYERHKDAGDLKCPKRPGLTAERWLQAMKERGKK